MASMHKKTQEWVKHGLITKEQAAHVLAFERDRKTIFSPFTILIFLGVFSVACGVVALVSANWFAIEPSVKLTGMFIVLGATAFSTALIKDKYPSLFEGMLFFNMLLFFAAIGLVGQVYHLKSDTYKAFLFWSGLSFPLLFLTRQVFFGYIWMPVFILSASFSPIGRDFWDFVFKNVLPVPMSISFLSAVICLSLVRVKAAAVFIAPLRFAAFCFAVLFLFGDASYRQMLQPDSVFAAYLPIMCCLVAVGFGWAVWNYMPFEMEEKKSVLIVLGLYIISLAMPSLPFGVYLIHLMILFAFVNVAFRFNREKLARVLSVLVAFRILKAFFVLFGSLLYTGLGLIFSGCVILGVAYGWFKVNDYLKVAASKKGKRHE